MSSKLRHHQRTETMGAILLRTSIEYFLADMRLRNRTLDSINTNRSVLGRFARYLGSDEIQLAAITEERVESYVEWLQTRGAKWETHPHRPTVPQPLSPFTIRKEVKILRGFGNWLGREQFPNPFKVLEIPSVPKLMVETLRTDEIEQVLQTLNPNSHHGARDYAMILLMLDSGLRISEVAELRLPMVDLSARHARVRGKGRKERLIPFGQTTTRALMRYVTAFRPKPVRAETDNVFLTLDGLPLSRASIEPIIRRLRNSSGVMRLRAHLLRHTFAVNYLAAGGDVESLRRILGHESLEVTKRYLSGLQAAQLKALYDDNSPIDRLGLPDTTRRFGRRGLTRRVTPEEKRPDSGDSETG